MSIRSVLKALASAGATTIIAGLSSGGLIARTTAGVLASALGIDPEDENLNEKIIERSRTQEGRDRIAQANLALEGKKAELFTSIELAKIQAKMAYAEGLVAVEIKILDADIAINAQSNESYRVELQHKSLYVSTTRPWLVRSYFHMIVGIVISFGVSFLGDVLYELIVSINCETDACWNFVSERKTYVTQLSEGMEGMETLNFILKTLGGAVVTWFGSRGLEKIADKLKAKHYE